MNGRLFDCLTNFLFLPWLCLSKSCIAFNGCSFLQDELKAKVLEFLMKPYKSDKVLFSKFFISFLARGSTILVQCLFY